MAVALEYNPKTKVMLSGSLAKKFFRSHSFQLDSRNVWEAFRALKAVVPGFADEIARLERLGMRFAIFRNRKNVGECEFELGGVSEIRIVPVISGSKRGGILQTVIGAVLIAASFIPGFQALMPVGIAMVAGGVVQMLSPQLGGLNTSAAPENQPSYAFGSARNTTASGNPVPLCIGKRRWGGAIISAGIYAEDQM